MKNIVSLIHQTKDPSSWALCSQHWSWHSLLKTHQHEWTRKQQICLSIELVFYRQICLSTELVYCLWTWSSTVLSWLWDHHLYIGRFSFSKFNSVKIENSTIISYITKKTVRWFKLCRKTQWIIWGGCIFLGTLNNHSFHLVITSESPHPQHSFIRLSQADWQLCFMSLH